MAHFWKDLYEVERNSVKENLRFIKKHRIGCGSLLMITGCSVLAAPTIIDAVHDKITETKNKKSKMAKLEERVTKLESRCKDYEASWREQIRFNGLIMQYQSMLTSDIKELRLK